MTAPLATRTQVLAHYRPLRGAIRRVLRGAPLICTEAEVTRAAWLLGLDPADPRAEPDAAIEMLADLSLFDPDASGRRAIDRFAAARGARGPATREDRALARRMAQTARFSVFHIAARHRAAGLWLEDMLDGGRRLWLVDEALETQRPGLTHLAMRIFDAGPYHCGFGIVAALDAAQAAACVLEQQMTGEPPFGPRFAAALYAAMLTRTTPERATRPPRALGAPRPGRRRPGTG
ncbi:hypothetical protein GCM10010964_37880 [Caldovatus sediminis]|uniref:Uncharacterized protein n=1 Tax=Caldovatus sediminis TaxID=2041189 RepID=A0A8J3EDR4_9PROT|nr:hypothetical protein [Caldovatus sediminis]GGG46958.1 hypothetical protein GCM10010964_37880 [Caldovatus sediminis]